MSMEGEEQTPSQKDASNPDKLIRHVVSKIEKWEGQIRQMTRGQPVANQRQQRPKLGTRLSTYKTQLSSYRAKQREHGRTGTDDATALLDEKGASKQQKEMSSSLDDILDLAVSKVAGESAQGSSAREWESAQTWSRREASSEVQFPPSSNSPFQGKIMPESLSTNNPRHIVSPSLSTEPEPSHDARVLNSSAIYVDSELRIFLDATTPDLQNYVFQLQDRLKASDPNATDLPYEIWTSTNRSTLITWLRILASKLQGLNHETKVAKEIAKAADPRPQVTLDHLAREHNMGNDLEASPQKSPVRKDSSRPRPQNQVVKEHHRLDEEIDWDEWDVGGMGFLKSNDPAKIKATSPAAHSRDERLSFQKIAKRLYSTSSRPPLNPSLVPSTEPAANTPSSPPKPSLPHLTSTGSAHMVSVSAKAHTTRTAIAVGTVLFTNPTPLNLIQTNSLKKGDVLSVSRIAGIMAAKKCPDIIPLCHPIALTHVSVQLKTSFPLTSKSQQQSPSADYSAKAVDGDERKSNLGFGGVLIEAKVECTGPTGVEMEALTSVMATALSVVDMCKAVDKFQRIQDVRVVLKEGGKSGTWREEGWTSWQE